VVDLLEQRIHRDRDEERRQEHSVVTEGDGGERVRRRRIELRASDGFGALEPTATKAWSWASVRASVSGMCGGGGFWRRRAQADER
jgi:hypothetical protein